MNLLLSAALWGCSGAGPSASGTPPTDTATLSPPMCAAPTEPGVVEDVTCALGGELEIGVAHGVDEVCVWTDPAADPDCYDVSYVPADDDACVRGSRGYTPTTIDCPAEGVRVELRTAGELVDCVVTTDDPALNPCGCRRFERVPDTVPCPIFESIGDLRVGCFGGESSWHVGLHDEVGGPSLSIVTATGTFEVPKGGATEVSWGCVVRPGCPDPAETVTILGRGFADDSVVDCAEAGPGAVPADPCRSVRFTLDELDQPPTCPTGY